MFLMIVILLLVIFFSYLPSYVPSIVKSFGSYFVLVSDEELNLRSQVRDMKSEQGTISMTDEFARYMKLQRKIDKLTDAIKKLGSSRTKRLTWVSMIVRIGVHVLHGLVMISFILLYRSEPLLMLSPDWFTPLNKVIAFPTGVPGGIGVTCWILVCTSVVYRLKSFLVT